jgi:hypothetical protein
LWQMAGLSKAEGFYAQSSVQFLPSAPGHERYRSGHVVSYWP